LIRAKPEAKLCRRQIFARIKEGNDTRKSASAPSKNIQEDLFNFEGSNLLASQSNKYSFELAKGQWLFLFLKKEKREKNS
jgi:hypothetical protein